MRYPIESEVALNESANPKYADPSLTEVNRAEKSSHGFPRIIGGDKGDLGFHGYTVSDGRTILYRPVLLTTIEGLTAAEASEIAQEILDESYSSIGVETVEHS